MTTSTSWLSEISVRRASLGRRLAIVLIALATLTGALTVAAFFKGGYSIGTIIGLLNINISILGLLIVLVGIKLFSLWRERRRQTAGSSLHSRIAMMFGLVAIVPALLVAALATAFLNYGFEGWFSERIRTAVDQSNTVAYAYLDEHTQNIRAVGFALASDLDANAAFILGANRNQIDQFLTAQADVRGLAEAIILDGNGQIIARSLFSQSFAFDDIDSKMLTDARQSGEIIVSTGQGDDRVRALVRLSRFVDSYLVVGRLIDANVLERVQRVEGAVRQYNTLETERVGIQVTFSTMFFVVALLMLFAAIWMGLILSDRLADPISTMAAAAERMREGDFTARVDAVGPAELATLGMAFNRMAEEIEVQQLGLIEANRALDERRRFIETVLGGVTAGVIGLDAGGRIQFPNRSASTLLAEPIDTKIGLLLADVWPEIGTQLNLSRVRPDRTLEKEIKLSRQGVTKTFLVRIAGERLDDVIVGFVVTFDDITELQSAQRKAAWADVARRIAHEIKNPLTPIQLSAERLKRRFLKTAGDDKATFEQCVDTISRQVSAIGTMVDEFSAFARMPQATIKPYDVSKVCNDAIFIERNRTPEIEVVSHLPDQTTMASFDRDQISRALVNLLKNASESVLAAQHNGLPHASPGRVELTAETTVREPGGIEWLSLSVSDTGIGLPAEDRDRLVEPYVTTREKGTGLGLAIVKKVVEDHGGNLTLADRPGGGAVMTMMFPRHRPDDTSEEQAPGSSPAQIG